MNNQTRSRSATYRETTDLAFGAYCHMRGLKIVKAQQCRRNRALEYKFIFDDPQTEKNPNGMWDEYLVDFTNSESRKYDSSVRALKHLGRRGSEN